MNELGPNAVRQIVGILGAVLCLIIAREFWKMYLLERVKARVAKLLEHVPKS